MEINFNLTDTNDKNEYNRIRNDWCKLVIFVVCGDSGDDQMVHSMLVCWAYNQSVALLLWYFGDPNVSHSQVSVCSLLQISAIVYCYLSSAFDEGQYCEYTASQLEWMGCSSPWLKCYSFMRNGWVLSHDLTNYS